MKRQILIPRVAIGTLIVTLVAIAPAGQTPVRTPITVYKTPTCGCCGKWVEHMTKAGFAPAVNDVVDLSTVRARDVVPSHLRSCHFAVVDGYVVEGHVPADVIRQLLKERPKVAGITVPGMPVGSPGMEQGTQKDPYDVVAFDRSGNTKVYAKR
jgi:hypothetical protein